jgi:nucleoside-diphosphate-sugar epimerase
MPDVPVLAEYPRRIDDIADGIVTAMHSPAGLNEDFNISAAQELTVAQIADVFGSGVHGRNPRRSRPALTHLTNVARM